MTPQIANSSAALRLGLPTVGPGVSEFVQAGVDDFRLAKGGYRHSRDFVVPTWAAATVQHDGGDDYRASVGLLITGQGANGSNPVDSGPGAVALTLNGTTITTAQFKYGTSSIGLNGSTNYIACNAGSYAGDFTLQYWARGNYYSNMAWSTTDVSYLYSGQLRLANTVVLLTAFGDPGSTTWNHICLMRKGTVVYLFINGALVGAATYTATVNLTGLQIGRYATNGNLYFNGQIQDFLVTGLARYPTTGFDIPTTLAPTFASNLGDPLYTTYLKLLVAANGTNGSTSFADGSSFARTLTAVGGAQISTAWSFAGGSSLSLSGSTDAVTAASSADFNLGNNSSFAIDFRYRPTSIAGSPWVFILEVDANNYCGMYMSAGVLFFSAVLAGVETHHNTGTTLAANTVYHIEIDQGPGFFRIFIDGVAKLLGAAAPLFSTPLPGLYGPALGSPGPNPTGKSLDGTPLLTSLTHGLLVMVGTLNFYGGGTIAGTTKIYSVPTNLAAPTRRVRLYDKVSGVLARETTSDGSGNYTFANLDKLRTYYVTAFDGLTGYDAVIHDNLTPV